MPQHKKSSIGRQTNAAKKSKRMCANGSAKDTARRNSLNAHKMALVQRRESEEQCCDRLARIAVQRATQSNEQRSARRPRIVSSTAAAQASETAAQHAVQLTRDASSTCYGDYRGKTTMDVALCGKQENIQ
ncbi:Hypothetical predicted protein [Octopus vulgaris]|uniref:Uncharacterized protein n=1 Tax=Octopus vulgaris TaxID=6645 RepID=A0AA36AYD2_OCTVU|nr:Hypothetical predicted protein [Octopus vulgaris]